jgi:4-diphosphocytidyl-2-C-methyl-D-erythritol kinase
MKAPRARAFAKINLSLRVLGTRPDGFHELRTIFQSLALHDTLTFVPTAGPFRFTCDDPGCPPDSANLVVRAARLVWKAAGRRGAPEGITIRLQKRIPMKAGLGGGSSDGAAAIRALGTLWRVDGKRQQAIAASLGADVPYFFEGGTVLGLGRGDHLFPLQDRPPAWVVLVLPAFGVSTADAFRWFDRARPGRAARPRRAAQRADDSQLVNDLEAPVGRRHPEIGRLIRALRRSGASHAAMTGSGSTVFGLFSRRNDAIEAAAALLGRGRRTLVTRSIDRKTYRRLAAK